MKNRILSMLLSLCMAVSLVVTIPVTASANAPGTGTDLAGALSITGATTLESGEYTLSDNIESTAVHGNITLADGAQVTLDLNGKTLDLGGRKITVPDGTTLTIHDSQSTPGTVKSASGSSGVAIRVTGGEFNLTGGTVSATGTGSIGVEVTGGTANISSGAVSAKGTGAVGVSITDGTANISSGAVSAEGTGAVGVSVTDGTANISGGTVSATGTGSVGIALGGSGAVYLSGTSRVSNIEFEADTASFYATDSTGTTPYAGDALVIDINADLGTTVVHNVTDENKGKFTLDSGFRKLLQVGDDLILSDDFDAGVTATTVEKGTGWPDTATYGVDWTGTIMAKSGQTLPTIITVTVDDTPLADNEFTYSSTTGDITVPGDKITGDITVYDAENYTVTLEFTNVVESFWGIQNWAIQGQKWSGTIEAARGYMLPADIAMTIGGVDYTGFTYTQSSGDIEIPGAYVTDDIVITAVGVPAVTVNGIKLADGKYFPSNGTEAVAAKPETGGWATFDAQTNTLTLHDFNLDMASGIRKAIEVLDGATIQLEGSSTLTGITGEYDGAILYGSGDMIFSGEGNLAVTTQGESYEPPVPIMASGSITFGEVGKTDAFTGTVSAVNENEYSRYAISGRDMDVYSGTIIAWSYGTYGDYAIYNDVQVHSAYQYRTAADGQYTSAEADTEASLRRGSYYEIKVAEAAPEPPEHTHVWASAWSGNSTHHWHACTAQDCGVTDFSGVQGSGYAVHNVVTDEAVDATCTTEGKTAGTHCSECEKVLTAQQTVPVLEHDFGTWVPADAANHTRTCSRNGEHTETAAHTYTDNADTTCDACGYVRTVDTPHTHTLTKTEAQAATCTTAGNSAYWTCTGENSCGKYFSDGAGTTEVLANSWVIPALEHDFGAWGPADAADHTRTCSRNSEHTETAAHTYTDNADTTCDACGYVRTVDTPEEEPDYWYPDYDNEPVRPSKPVEPDKPTQPEKPEQEPCEGGEDCHGRQFSDVDTSEWYHEGVDYVIETGMMEGSDKGFEPLATTSRAMIWTILTRLDGETVSGEQWDVLARQIAMNMGISDGTNGSNAITREQLAVMLWRYAQYKGYDVSAGESTNLLSWPDAFEVSEYAVSAMQWATGVGIINGKDGMLQPDSVASRAEVATMLMRFIKGLD